MLSRYGPGHAVLPQFYDAGQLPSGIPYLVMELLEGQSVIHWLEETRPSLVSTDVVAVGLAVLRAIGGLHRVGIIHRDLDPNNVFRERGGRIRILDLGCAHHPGRSETLTLPGEHLGTRRCLDPLVELRRRLDLTSDLYSIGCLLYRMWTGRFPRSDSADPVAAAAAGVPLRLPGAGEALVEMPPRFAVIIGKLLSCDPLDRYPNAAAVEDALLRLHEPNAINDGTGSVDLVAEARTLCRDRAFARGGDLTSRESAIVVSMALAPVARTLRDFIASLSDWDATSLPRHDPKGESVWDSAIALFAFQTVFGAVTKGMESSRSVADAWDSVSSQLQLLRTSLRPLLVPPMGYRDLSDRESCIEKASMATRSAVDILLRTLTRLYRVVEVAERTASE